MERIKNEDIRGTAHVRCFGGRVKEVRQRWLRHVQRRDREARRMLWMKLPGRRPRGRPKTGYMDVVREDMESV